MKKTLPALSRARLIVALVVCSLMALPSAWSQQATVTPNYKEADIRQIVEAMSAKCRRFHLASAQWPQPPSPRIGPLMLRIASSSWALSSIAVRPSMHRHWLRMGIPLLGVPITVMMESLICFSLQKKRIRRTFSLWFNDFS